jgi:hypothetical protein
MCGSRPREAILFNDPAVEKPLGAIGMSLFFAILFGFLWISAFVGFKMGTDDLIAAWREKKADPGPKA